MLLGMKLRLQILVIRLRLQKFSRFKKNISQQRKQLQQIITLDNATHVLKQHLRAMILGNLCILLQNEAEHQAGPEAQFLLDQALTCIQEASDIFEHEIEEETDQIRKAELIIDLAKAQMNMGIVYYIFAERHTGTESITVLDAAQVCYESALRVFAIGKEDEVTAIAYALTQLNLGNVLSLRAERNEDSNVEELECEALACYDEALRFLERGSAEYIAACANKGGVLRVQAERRGGTEAGQTYQQALDYYTEALNSSDPHSPAYAVDLMKMAYTLQDIARLQGGGVEAVALLRQSVDAYNAVLDSVNRREQSEDYAMALTDKGTALRALARLREDEEAVLLLEQAISCYDQALTVRDRIHMAPQYAATQISKSSGLLEWAERQGKERAEGLLELAIDCCDKALVVYREQGMRPQYAAALQNKANALLEQAKLSHGEKVIHLTELAIDHYDQSLEVYTYGATASHYAIAQQNKGNALVWLAKQCPSQAQQRHLLEQAITCYSVTIEIYPQKLTPQKHRTAALWLAQTHLALSRLIAGSIEANAQLAQAWEAAASGIEAARILERLAPSLEFRQTEWIENAAMYAVAASIRASQGDIAEAVSLLETGRARGLAEAQSYRHTDLSLLTIEEQEEYRTCVNAVLDIEARCRQVGNFHTSLALATEAATANDALTRLVDRLRQTHHAFLEERHITVEQLVRILRPDEVLVYLIPQSCGTLVLYIPSTKRPKAIWLNLTDDDLFALAVHADEKGYKRRGYLPAVVGLQPEDLDKALDELLPLLGEQLMRQVIHGGRELEARRAILVPGGILAALPLHAASYIPLAPQDIPTAPNGLRYACDDLLITYTPSGTAFLTARERGQNISALERGFVVGNPMLVQTGHPWDKRVRGYLPNAEREATAVANFMRSAGLKVTEIRGAEATWQAVFDGLSDANVAHLAMHAIFEPTDPFSSALLVASGEKIFVRDLLDSRRIALQHLRLVILSACQSALGDFERQKEEAIGVFGALLAAGASAVVGSLWPVNDYLTRPLMEAFTQRYLINQEPATALHDALQWFRKLPDVGLDPTVPSSLIPEQKLPEVEDNMFKIDQDKRIVTKTDELSLVRQLTQEDRTGAADDTPSRPVSPEHPMHWSAFVYYGS